jgi:nicotine blue oxidoreductase
MIVHGLLLAAGAGRRYGGPKALVDGWLVQALAVLADGGCTGRTVVLGAESTRARELVPDGVDVVVADDWAEGMGASLRDGLSHLPDADAAVVHLVDLPDVGADVVRRVLDRALDRSALARATYDGALGHPVLLGRDHWAAVVEAATGDTGARDYLAARDVTLVECGDLATGRDVDH